MTTSTKSTESSDLFRLYTPDPARRPRLLRLMILHQDASYEMNESEREWMWKKVNGSELHLVPQDTAELPPKRQHNLPLDTHQPGIASLMCTEDGDGLAMSNTRGRWQNVITTLWNTCIHSYKPLVSSDVHLGSLVHGGDFKCKFKICRGHFFQKKCHSCQPSPHQAEKRPVSLPL